MFIFHGVIELCFQTNFANLNLAERIFFEIGVSEDREILPKPDFTKDGFDWIGHVDIIIIFNL